MTCRRRQEDAHELRTVTRLPLRYGRLILLKGKIDMRKITEVVLFVTIWNNTAGGAMAEILSCWCTERHRRWGPLGRAAATHARWKPDFSGNWVRVRGEGAFDPPELQGLFRDRPRAQVPGPPADPNSPPIAAFWEMGANIQGGLPRHRGPPS